jgi:hypothetical protein
MKNESEAKRIAERENLTNVKFMALIDPDDDTNSAVIAVVGDREGGPKNVVFSASAKTTLAIDSVSSLFEED